MLQELQTRMFKRVYYLGLILGSFSKCLTLKRLEPETSGARKHFPVSENSTLDFSPATTGDGPLSKVYVGGGGTSSF